MARPDLRNEANVDGVPDADLMKEVDGKSTMMSICAAMKMAKVR